MRAEKEAIREAIVRFAELGLKGAVVTVGDRVEAFTIGTALTPGTAVIQIEIANPDITGLAQWINREFVRREWPGMTFINREQDLGVPGLRRAKLSYQPDHLVKKYNLTASEGMIRASAETLGHQAVPRSSGLPPAYQAMRLHIAATLTMSSTEQPRLRSQ